MVSHVTPQQLYRSLSRSCSLSNQSTCPNLFTPSSCSVGSNTLLGPEVGGARTTRAGSGAQASSQPRRLSLATDNQRTSTRTWHTQPTTCGHLCTTLSDCHHVSQGTKEVTEESRHQLEAKPTTEVGCDWNMCAGQEACIGTEKGQNRTYQDKKNPDYRKKPGTSLEEQAPTIDVIWWKSGSGSPTRKVTLTTKETSSCLLFL